MGQGDGSHPRRTPPTLPAPGWAPLPSPAARRAPRAAAPLPPQLWAAASGTRGCCTRGSGCPKEPGTSVSRLRRHPREASARAGQDRALPHRDPARRSHISAPSCPSSRRTPGEGWKEAVTGCGTARRGRGIPSLTMSTVICPMAVLPCCCLKLLIFACSLGIMLARTSFRFWEDGRGP